MKYLPATLLLPLLLTAAAASANAEAPGGEVEQLRGIVKNLMEDNAAFVRSHKPDYYLPFAGQQRPRATVVTCADSRVHSHALDRTPDGDLFMVRNIGNQIATAEGSVEYGVRHLHTPLLIIVGHVGCGAVKAARGDYAKESPAIRRELATLKLPAKNPQDSEDEDILRGVGANVNTQVSHALKLFDREHKQGRLAVIGAIYDFRDELRQGRGRLVITNINGATDAGSIMAGLMKINGNRLALDRKPAEQKAATH